MIKLLQTNKTIILTSKKRYVKVSSPSAAVTSVSIFAKARIFARVWLARVCKNQRIMYNMESLDVSPLDVCRSEKNLLVPVNANFICVLRIKLL